MDEARRWPGPFILVGLVGLVGDLEAVAFAFALEDLEWGERVALKRVGADGFMVFAMSMRPSVNMSAANLDVKVKGEQCDLM